MTGLSPAEYRTLAAYARLGDRQAVSTDLGLSYATVRGYLAAAYAKLGVNGAIDAFRALGWLTPPERTGERRYELAHDLAREADRLEYLLDEARRLIG